MSATMSTTTSAAGGYKGKATHRSWPQLPEELVRHIATFYLYNLAATNYCPQTWDIREYWHQRMVYTALRDAVDLEKNFMSICPQWHHALENHLFWQQAIALIDPMDYLGIHMFIQPKLTAHHINSSAPPPPPIRLSPYRHFRNITSCSCIVCRINAPPSNLGLTTAKRTIHTPFIGQINLCREHDRRRAAYCGLCLREASALEAAGASTHELVVACVENEDDETWPNVDATCRSCRIEWLWRRCQNSRDREAVGGLRMISEDWETRQIVDGFVDLAEGSISDVLNLAREKHWLRKNTRLGDMMQQALAARRFNTGTSGRGGGSYDRVNDYEFDVDLEEEEEEEDDEDEAEIMQTEENGVREIALGDWARARILDGHWFSPADTWYGNVVPGRPMYVQALHPCPWIREGSTTHAIEPSGSSAVEREEADPDSNLTANVEVEEEHPKLSTVHAEIPPSYALCEQAYIAHQKQMRIILLPPMRNLVRRIVMECDAANEPAAGSKSKREDPAVRATRMNLEEVVKYLREEEGVWFDGVDWAEKLRNEDAALKRRREDEAEQAAVKEASKKRRRGDDSASSSSSSNGSAKSSLEEDSSNSTSPVLSTTTLQTTPSPPPLSDESTVDGSKDENQSDRRQEQEDDVQQEQETRPITIPVSPVMNPPRLLRAIPFVPETVAHLPHYSFEALRLVWREACAPLYHCRCKICERAMAISNQATGGGHAPPSVVSSQPHERTPPPTKLRPVRDPALTSTEETDSSTAPDEIVLREITDEELLATLGAEDAELPYLRRKEEEEESEDVEEDNDSLQYDMESYNAEDYEEDLDDARHSLTSSSDVDITSRKRSSDELDEDYDAEETVSLGDVDDTLTSGHRALRPRPETPPKRARKGERYSSVEELAMRSIELSPRLQKRSSEELDERESGGGGFCKRPKVDVILDGEGKSNPRALAVIEDKVWVPAIVP